MVDPDREGALVGIRVLDLTQVMAGPFCTMLLADMGAEVIKVENPAGGDQTRHSWGRSLGVGDSNAFQALNRNKRSVGLDLKSAGGKAAFLSLVREADVVVENFRPGVTARLGIDHEHLLDVNPRLVYCSISGYGQTGPYAQLPGYDLMIQAMVGVMSITGELGGPPMKSAVPIADLGAGLYAAIGILAGVLHARRTGEGQYVETSLYESALSMAVWESAEYWLTGQVPGPLGSANRMSAPYQALRARDGYLTVGANNQKLWRLTCSALDREDLVEDPRFAENAQRMTNRAQLQAELESTLETDDVGAWVARLEAAGVPAAPIRAYDQVLEPGRDPQVTERGMIQYVEHPERGAIPVLGPALRFSRTPATVRRRAPLLGEDTDHYTRAEIAVPMSRTQEANVR